MKIGSFDTSSVTSALSNMVDKVEAKVDSAVSSVQEKAAQVENFAASEFKQATDFAKVTGAKVEQTFDAAVSTAKEALPSFRVPQGVSDLGRKVFGDSKPAPGVEGGANLNVTNGADPSKVVDLKKPEEVLAAYGQKDKDKDTNSDGARCQSNVMVAGLLMKSGPDGLKKGLGIALDDARTQLAAEKDPGRKAALERAVTNLQTAVDNIGDGKATTVGHLDRSADALFTLMSPAESFEKNGDLKGGIDGIKKSDIQKMEQKLGLSDGAEPQKVGEKWFAPLTEDNAEVEQNVWEAIKPGTQAHVGVNLYGEHKVTGKAPDGTPLQTDSYGRQFFTEQVNGKTERTYVDQRAQHAVLFGKNADGTRYIYNPIGDPPFVTEKPGDAQSTAQLDAMATALMGVKPGKDNKSNDWQADVTPY